MPKAAATPKPRLAGMRPALRGLTVGYNAPAFLEKDIADATRPNLPLSIGLLLADQLIAYGVCGLAMLGLVRGGVVLGVCGAFVASLVTSRCQRGLECMVHEGSHYTISSNKSLNDRLANLLAAFPMVSTVEGFRASHTRHHGRFAVQRSEVPVDVSATTETGNARSATYVNRYDPDLHRALRLRWDELDWSKRGAFLSGMVRRLPRYSLDWFREIGSGGRALVNGLLWHLASFVVLGAALGVKTALGMLSIWMFSFLVVLPVCRFVAEAQEHDYLAGTTQFATTISNTGFLNWWLHPHGDGHHAEHHSFLKVPGFRLRRLARTLVEQDPKTWGASHLYRVRVIQIPTKGHVGPVGQA